MRNSINLMKILPNDINEVEVIILFSTTVIHISIDIQPRKTIGGCSSNRSHSVSGKRSQKAVSFLDVNSLKFIL